MNALSWGRRYSEAITLLYTETHFHFIVASVQEVECFGRSLPTQHLEAIGFLSMDPPSWPLNPMIWHELTHMKGLKTLRIDARQSWFGSVNTRKLWALVEELRTFKEHAHLLEVVEIAFDGEENEIWEEWREKCERTGVRLVLKEINRSDMGLQVSNIDYLGGYHFQKAPEIEDLKSF